MARRCTICDHPQRKAIEKLLVSRVSAAQIARDFAVSEDAVPRHREKHLPEVVAAGKKRRGAQETRNPSRAASRATKSDAEQGEHVAELASQVARQDADQAAHELDVMADLAACLHHVKMLFVACHEWLLDPADATRYTLEPRASEVDVIYWEQGPDDKPRRRKEKLDTLLGKLVATGAVQGIERWEAKTADTRSLVLKTAGQLQSHIEFLARLQGLLVDKHEHTGAEGAPLTFTIKIDSRRGEGDDEG